MKYIILHSNINPLNNFSVNCLNIRKHLHITIHISKLLITKLLCFFTISLNVFNLYTATRTITTTL